MMFFTCCMALLGSMFFANTAFAQSTVFSQKPFTDIAETSSDFQAIEYLRTHNVIKGYLDGTFKPETRINRAEFVEFVINPFILDTNGRGACVKANASDASAHVFYSDVSKDAWYAENVCFATTKHIIDGYPDGTFRPADAISFVEAAKVISNVFSVDLDAYQVGEFWYRPYVQSLSNMHAIPTSVRRFGQPLTRAEMAQIVFRLSVDSQQQASMEFDSGRNILFQRPQPVVSTVTLPKPPVVAKVINRPSRRSVVAAAKALQVLRSAR